jgi:hypothetical protein
MDRRFSPRTAMKLASALKHETRDEAGNKWNIKDDGLKEELAKFESSTILYETITPSKKLL